MPKSPIDNESKKKTDQFMNWISKLSQKRRYAKLIKMYKNNPRIVSKSRKNEKTKIEFLTQDLEKIQHEPIIINDDMHLEENQTTTSLINDRDDLVMNDLTIDNDITLDDVILDTNQIQIPDQTEYGTCCFCGEGCNPASQACGRCIRNGHNY
ncbi:hypothetical protein QJ857_gp1009 [Tupanvirus soda lake]|uniref:Uncharacterized protein n=2 Tax=Tupanvirus TaxID=2094720 RepID=A0A6N1NK07_9VIRU|nr:hypothetical protein QJ857_gp1009 [Tupanvirus soda lake]QKU35045.1 hypothetical protein [Tupanvirus soda lake]